MKKLLVKNIGLLATPEGKRVLEANFNKNYFTKIDIRVQKEIKLYSKSARILTMHPSSSYTLQQDANKQKNYNSYTGRNSCSL